MNKITVLMIQIICWWSNKLDIKDIRAKFKFGQHLNEDRFDMIIKHLEDRGQEIDITTIKLMKSLKN